jgi:hypothetical protein
MPKLMNVTNQLQEIVPWNVIRIKTWKDATVLTIHVKKRGYVANV